MKAKSVILLMLITSPLLMSAKKDNCAKFHECVDCRPPDSLNFQVHGLSQSALLEIGVPSTLEIDLYGGKDYIVTACTKRAYYPIHMRVMDEESEILFDNQIDDYVESVGFTLDSTKRIFIEVTLLAEQISAQNFDENRSCTGINIMWRLTPKIGF